MEVKTKKFKDVFDKIPLSRAIVNEFAMAEIRRIVVHKKSRHMVIRLSHNRIIKESHIRALQQEIRAQMPHLEHVHVKIKYNLHEMSIEKAVSRYWENLLYSVRLLSPVCHKMLEAAEWTFHDGELCIRLNNSSLLLFMKKGIDKELQNLLDEGLGNIKVVFEKCEEIQEATPGDRSMHGDRFLVSPDTRDLFPCAALPPGAAAPPRPGKPLRKGRGVQISSAIEGDPFCLSEELTIGNEILIQGKIIAFDKRELKNERYLITFDVTDFTNSITVKLFVKSEKYAEFERILKIGNTVAARGIVQYDDYSKEINMLASRISAAEQPPAKMDDAPVKRVELHLHTQMSAMDGITPAKEYIKRAAKWGHRAIAITDHGVVQAFPDIMDACKGTGVKPIYGMEAYLMDDPAPDEKKPKYYHAVILVRNDAGLRNLYELVSKSHLRYFSRRPRVPRSELIKHREGLLVGTACDAGEFFLAVLNNSPEEEVERLAKFYDYFEIQPVGNNMHLIRSGKVQSEEEIRDIYRKIMQLGERYNKPVVATCDVHFIDPDDEIYRRIIMAGEGYKDADMQAPLYFRTTEEMLAEFAYLGDDAKKAVIDNTNLIANMIDEIKPIPDEIFPPKIDGADDEIFKIAMDRAKAVYGDELPKPVADRMKQELNSIIKNGFSVMYIIAQKLVHKSLEDGYLVGSRGSVGSSFVATMLGITEVNPLAPHYICPECRYSDFESSGEYSGASGYDMPDRECPDCGTKLIKDGHDIPFETFLGFDGDKEPDIDLNFSGEYQARAHAYVEEMFGSDYVFKAGTISTIADKTAYGFVKKYLDERRLLYRNAEINRIVSGCTGIKRTTGQHPGGLMILPRGHSIYEFCPVQHPANAAGANVVTTHFDYHSISGRLLKLDVLGHDVPTIIRMLHDITGIDPRTVDLGDKRVISLFTSPDALGVTEKDIRCKTGTLGLPEFGTSFVRQMLMDTQPDTFSELVRISGLSHGTDVWINNAADLIRNKVATLKEVIPTRDDIMVYLVKCGVEKKAAFRIMESVRKGKGVNPDDESLMREAGIPEWYVQSCKRIKYMFPKGHAVAYVMMTVRIAYFKIYHPYSFYAGLFSVKYDDFDYETMCHGRETVTKEMNRISELGKDAGVKDKSKFTLLELVLEMYARGLAFLKLDLYKAQVSKFIVTNEGLMPPLCSIQGLGITAAQSIAHARDQGAFTTVENFRERTNVNKTVVELLKTNHILDQLPETDQMSLFYGDELWG